MNCTKKVLISFCTLFFAVTSKTLATEKLEAKMINQINEKQQTTFNSSVSTDFYEFEKVDYLKQNRLGLGNSIQDIIKYDLRDKININIRNQEKTMLCWIYSTNTVVETNMKLNNIKSNTEFDVKFADEETAKIFNKKSSAGLGNDYEGGTQLLLLNYYISGKGLKNIENKIDIEIEDYVLFPMIYKQRLENTIKYYSVDAMTGEQTNCTEEEVKRNKKQNKRTYSKIWCSNSKCLCS